MPSTTSTTSMRRSERLAGRLTVVARNARARSRPTRLIAIVAHPAHPADGRHLAVVTATHAPCRRYFTILPGGNNQPSPDGGAPAPAASVPRAA